ncbi:MAG: sce7725 family protein [Candidatus Scalindua sp.]|jgi:hypothetical protein|nr:sce7725 family protein [Candidatus Scalindua sp.]MBT5304345.1 sce7725 family protein [Candidatus Scalindua sp.]MBT6053225.1 sce7725 family protein [Candidatus Scalindua sp.]MBT6227072.1 sce7725 family protein [Candidatus Scalindua sp.]MBT7213287.1 sce7725 family protein [Candidatus Scalindua sp.]
MYFPYFRGKQNELIAIRDNASMIKDAGIIPIIEPVKENLSPLKRAVSELTKVEGEFILIVNPKHGDLKNNPKPLFEELIEKNPKIYEGLSLGYIVNDGSNLMDIEDFLGEHEKFNIAIIHYGYPKGKDLADSLNKFPGVEKHIFIDGYSGKLYQKHFKVEGAERILVRDGFKQRKNAEYPGNEHFSDLHITYEDEGMRGFGDFLIVGDDYMETGGPAYAIAIHLTYLDDEKNMFIWHFLSDRTNSPVDPAGKFFEALEKLITVIDDDTFAFNSRACDEFRHLHKRGHFPGLGHVKKLSMQHHIELLSDYLKDVTE